MLTRRGRRQLRVARTNPAGTPRRRPGHPQASCEETPAPHRHRIAAYDLRMATRRLDLLRSRLDERLLVTNLVNIRYLTGFDASNAALLVEPRGTATLFTDFRYIESAHEVKGVKAQQTKRSLLADVAERLEGRLAFEADVLPYAQVETLRRGGLDLVPSSGLAAALRAVKESDEIDAIGRPARAAARAFEALTAEPWAGRSERALA